MLKVGILGFADLSGSTTANILISERRAREVHKHLVNNGVSEEVLLAKGLGTLTQKVDAQKLSMCASQRCVVFEVYIN